MARSLPERETGAALARRLRRRWALLDAVATVVGAFVVFAFLHAVHAAEDPHHTTSAALTGTLQRVAFLALTLPLGWAWRRRRTRALWAWLADERPAEMELALEALRARAR